jgi:hypothetical protein
VLDSSLESDLHDRLGRYPFLTSIMMTTIMQTMMPATVAMDYCLFLGGANSVSRGRSI